MTSTFRTTYILLLGIILCPSLNHVTCGLGQLTMGTKFRSAACPWETVFLWSVSMKFPISAEKKWTFKFWSELFFAEELGSGREITVFYSAAGAAATLNKVTGETEWQRWQGRVGLWGERWQCREPLKQHRDFHQQGHGPLSHCNDMMVAHSWL